MTQDTISSAEKRAYRDLASAAKRLIRIRQQKRPGGKANGKAVRHA